MKKLLILLCTWAALSAGAAFDFGNTQIGIHESLAPNVVKHYLLTVPEVPADKAGKAVQYAAGELKFSTDPNTRGSAIVQAVVACEGVEVANQSVLVNTASARTVSFPVKANSRCGFTLTTRQGSAFALNVAYKKPAVVTVPPKRG